MTENNTLTAVPGVRVGHWTDVHALTGLTVVLFPGGAVGAVSVRGGAPGTRETALLAPGNTVERVDGFLLTGGSAFGLDAAAGVMGFLAGCGIGFSVGRVVVPIVPAAVVFDMGIGEPRAPGPEAAAAACEQACEDPVAEGSVGAGTGCTVGKLRGMDWATRGGLGSSAVFLGGEATVAALAVVNSLGEVVDAEGRILAGVRGPGGSFVAAEEILLGEGCPPGVKGSNTTLVVVATDARLDRARCTRVAEVAHDGLARSIRPCHTSLDGDTIFAASVGEVPVHPDRVAAAAVLAVQRAVGRAVLSASCAAGLPAGGDVIRSTDP